MPSRSSPEPCTIYLESPKLPQLHLCQSLWGAEDWRLCPGRKLGTCWPWNHHSEWAVGCVLQSRVKRNPAQSHHRPQYGPGANRHLAALPFADPCAWSRCYSGAQGRKLGALLVCVLPLPQGSTLLLGTILTEARLDVLRARLPPPHSPLWL